MSGWSQLEHDAVDRLSAMGPMEIAVYVALLRHCDQERKCFPSMTRIAAVAGVKERRARMAVAKLVGSGLVYRQVQSGVNGGTLPPVYSLPLLTPQEPAAQNDTGGCDVPEGAAQNDRGGGAQNATLTRTNRTRTKEQEGTPGQKFIPPTIQDVSAYCRERKNAVDPQQFIDHYEARGWKFKGGQSMKDWHAAVRTWERNGFQSSSPAKPKEPIKYRA
jgi:hypothetical protein